jgi:DNA repair photolyase
VLGVSGVTDPYQTIERHLGLTRRCLEVLAECRNPVTIVTKSALVARDADLLADLAGHGAAGAFLSITTLDADLARRMEPRASSPVRRLEAIARLADAGVPVGVMVAPIIPGLNDHEVPAILKAAAENGARYAGYTVLRLPHAVRDLFLAWLEDHYPERASRIVNRIREVRGGELSDAQFGRRMRGEGVYADHIARLFEIAKRRNGFVDRRPAFSAAAFRRPAKSPAQPRLC